MTGTLAALRPLRTELLGVGFLVALWLLVAGAIVIRLLSLQIPLECFDVESAEPSCIPMAADLVRYQDLAGNWLTAVALLASYLPALASIVLGIAVVGKELDQRTAVLAWSLDPSRRHWLLQRAVPLLVVGVALGLAASQVIPTMLRLRSPGSDLAVDFGAIPQLGPGPAAMAVSAFGLTVMVGAVVGRVLPTVLAAGALVIAGGILVAQVNERWMNAESLVAESALVVEGRPIDYLLRAPDGRIISWESAFPDYADPNTGELAEGVTEMIRYVPIEIYPEVATRFALLHLIVGLAALTVAFAVVERRSP